ncbi:hypothetical protein HDV06_000801 [Boothiomyces sp. JEL0866]|nr:hypothetical protein HDV06_000801 [Boothiomyces sp. JEL0866]
MVYCTTVLQQEISMGNFWPMTYDKCIIAFNRKGMMIHESYAQATLLNVMRVAARSGISAEEFCGKLDQHKEAAMNSENNGWTEDYKRGKVESFVRHLESIHSLSKRGLVIPVLSASPQDVQPFNLKDVGPICGIQHTGVVPTIEVQWTDGNTSCAPNPTVRNSNG